MIPDIINRLADQTNPSQDYSQVWKLLPLIDTMSPKEKNLVHRLNSFGSLYYFIKVVLQRNQLTTHLHQSICNALECTLLKVLLKIPRDHFKSTICSEGAPIWWALPFNDDDARYMEALGYSNEWLQWMRSSHDQDTRTLIVSAVVENAIKLGQRVDKHYQNNTFFRKLFKEVIPSSAESWTVKSMTQKRSTRPSANHGEGTFDYIGVGGALQSRHYVRTVQDDLVGKDALESPPIMQDAIDYHKLLVGAYEAKDDNPDATGDEVVVGNNWSFSDLNTYIEEHEMDFKIIGHSAEGGCCSLHPANQPIFPEHFSMQKLAQLRERLGDYFYSCQYLNNPIPPSKAKFSTENLRFFDFKPVEVMQITADNKPRMQIVHEVYNGVVTKNLLPKDLQREMIVDPSHEGQGRTGRSRHCIIVLGYDNQTQRQYILDCWAETASFEDLLNHMYRLGKRWKIRQPWIEAIAFQKFLKFHIESMKPYRLSAGEWVFDKVQLLKVDSSLDAKTKRIEGMTPIYGRGDFWIPRSGSEKFIEEYKKYPYYNFRDILDTIGYSLQIYKPGRMKEEELGRWLAKTQSYRSGQSTSITGY